jgi:hypothetical protein
MAEQLKASTVYFSTLSAESILRERREEQRKRIRTAEVGKERELEKIEINIYQQQPACW